MPEGDTLFRAARALHQALAGKVVTRFVSRYAQPAAVDDQSPVRGRVVEKVEAQGKHLLHHFSGDLVLHTHMRMNGSWHLYRPGEKWQRAEHRMRLLLEVEGFVTVGFDIPVAELLTHAQVERHRDLRSLGPDLLGGEVDVAEVLRRFRARAHLPLGEALLNQRVMAGVGNVYKSELLFLRGLHPEDPVALASDAELSETVALAQTLLRANVREGKGDGIVTYTGLRRTTGRADPGERLWVYGRGGQPCRRCGTPIVVTHPGDAARITYACPTCQPRRVGGSLSPDRSSRGSPEPSRGA